MAKSMVDLGAEKIGMYQFYSTSAVFYSGKVAVKLISPREVTFRQEEELDWSSKYTMPTQGIVEFGANPPLADQLIIVSGKQREQLLLETALCNYQLLKDSKGLSYYSSKE